MNNIKSFWSIYELGKESLLLGDGRNLQTEVRQWCDIRGSSAENIFMTMQVAVELGGSDGSWAAVAAAWPFRWQQPRFLGPNTLSFSQHQFHKYIEA